MRPFWIHQLVEYLIGVALVAQGLQSPEPLVPAVAGVIVILNAAITIGPMSAFRVVKRSQHKWADVVVMAVLVLAAAQPWIASDIGGRMTIVVMLLPLGFLWFYTDWADKVSRKQRRAAQAGVKGEDIGRSAGRMAGRMYKKVKDR